MLPSIKVSYYILFRQTIRLLAYCAVQNTKNNKNFIIYNHRKNYVNKSVLELGTPRKYSVQALGIIKI